MTLNEFINTYNGKGVDTDGAYGYQCMDLMHRYVADVLGMGTGLFAAPTAYEAYLSAKDSRFDKVGNTPAGVPQPGDIIFWDKSVGSAGHVAIFIDGNTQQFRSFDQNWPTGSVSHVQTHNYNGVAGWLHPKSATPPPTNQGASDVIQPQDKDYVRIINSEVKGWDFNQVHSGSLDAREMAAWTGHDWKQLIGEGWQESGAWRDRRQAALAYYDTKAANDKQIADLTAKVADLQSQLAAQGGDTVQLNALGSALKWFIQRLGLK